MDEIRSWWEVPSIAHFCSLFRVAFNLFDFEIEELEESFLSAGTPDGSPLLIDLLSSLLAGCYNKREIKPEDVPKFLYDIIKRRFVPDRGVEHPIDVHGNFHSVPIRTKVEIVHAICDYRLDSEDVCEQLKGLEGDNLRLEPLGKDSTGALYWYFYGSRLYKEIPLPKPKIEKEKKKRKMIESSEEEVKYVTPKKKKKKRLDKRKKKEKKEEVPSSVQDGVRRSSRVRRKVEIKFDSDSEDDDEVDIDSEVGEEPEKVRRKKKGSVKKSKSECEEKVESEVEGKPKKVVRKKKVGMKNSVSESDDEVDSESEVEEKPKRIGRKRKGGLKKSKTGNSPDHKSKRSKRNRSRTSSPVKEENESENGAMEDSQTVESQQESTLNDDKSPEMETNKAKDGIEIENFKPKVNGEQLTNGEAGENEDTNDLPSTENGETEMKVEDKVVKIEHSEINVEGKNVKTDVKDAENKTETKPSDPPGTWSLRCSTVEEWTDLCESLKDSSVKCERDLYKIILEDFLPEIPRLIEEKDKLIRKRLMELAPRRLSSRIEKKAEIDRQRREEWLATLSSEQLEDALKEEEDQRIKRQLQRDLDERRRKEAEMERIESEKKAEEDRVRAKAERAERLKLREERARLIAEGKFIPPEFSPPSRSKYKPEVLTPKFPVDGKTQHALKLVMGKLMEHHDAWLFRDPVDEEYAPGYYDVIDEPMDLNTMKHKLASSCYRDASEFAGDFKLVIDNCVKFNGFESQCSVMAAKLERSFHIFMDKYLPDLILEKSELLNKDPSFREFETNFRRRSGTQRAIDKLQKAANNESKFTPIRSDSPFRRKKVEEAVNEKTEIVSTAPKLSATTDSLKHRLLNQFMHAKLEKEKPFNVDKFKPYTIKRVETSLPQEPVDPAVAASVALTPTSMYPRQHTRYSAPSTPSQPFVPKSIPSLTTPASTTAPGAPTSTANISEAPGSTNLAVSAANSATAFPGGSKSDAEASTSAACQGKKEAQKRYTIQTPFGSTITLNKPQRPETPKPRATPPVTQASIRLSKAQILGLLQQSPSLQKQLLANQAQGKPMVISNQQIYETISSQLGKILPVNASGQAAPAKVVMRIPGEGIVGNTSGQVRAESVQTTQPTVHGVASVPAPKVPVRSTQIQDAGQSERYQTAGQDVRIQGSGQNIQYQGANPNVQIQGTGPRMQFQGASQNVQIQRSGPIVQGQGTAHNLQPGQSVQLQAGQKIQPIQSVRVLGGQTIQQPQTIPAQKVQPLQGGHNMPVPTVQKVPVQHGNNTHVQPGPSIPAQSSQSVPLQTIHTVQNVQSGQTVPTVQNVPVHHGQNVHQAQTFIVQQCQGAPVQTGQRSSVESVADRAEQYGSPAVVTPGGVIRGSTTGPQRLLVQNHQSGQRFLLQTTAQPAPGQTFILQTNPVHSQSVQIPVQSQVSQSQQGLQTIPQSQASSVTLSTEQTLQAQAALQKALRLQAQQSGQVVRVLPIQHQQQAAQLTTQLVASQPTTVSPGPNVISVLTPQKSPVKTIPGKATVKDLLEAASNNKREVTATTVVSGSQPVSAFQASVPTTNVEAVNVVSAATSQPQPHFIPSSGTVIINAVPTAVLGRMEQPNASGGYPKLVHHYPMSGASFVQLAPSALSVQQSADSLVLSNPQEEPNPF